MGLVVIPNTFVAGTKAIAAKINANFKALVEGINSVSNANVASDAAIQEAKLLFDGTSGHDHTGGINGKVVVTVPVTAIPNGIQGVVRIESGTVNPVNSGADTWINFGADFDSKPMIECYFNADVGEGAQWYSLTKMYEHSLLDHKQTPFIGNIEKSGFRFHNTYTLPVSLYWIALGVGGVI